VQKLTNDVCDVVNRFISGPITKRSLP